MSEKEEVDSKLDYWSGRWKEGMIGWHQAQVDRYLLKHYEVVTGKALPSSESATDSEEQRQKDFSENSLKTWYVPLCGKSLDIPFLLGLGYKVFAVEGVSQAIETLNEEHSLGLVFDKTSSVFEGANGRLKIYCGDFFTCPVQQFGPFDFVWDRGSLVAIEYSCREAYKVAIQRALKGKDGLYYGFTYLLESTRYDKTTFGGPPRSLYAEDIEELFGDWTEVRQLDQEPLPETHHIWKKGVTGPAYSCIHLITPKKI